MSAYKNDGTIPYGSRVLTINGVDYVATNIEIRRPEQAIKRYNQLGEPSGSVGIADFVEGTATLQLATTSTVIPVQGLEFSATFIVSVGSETFYLTEITQPEGQTSEKLINVTFRKKYN